MSNFDIAKLEKLSGNICKNLKVLNDYCSYNKYDEDTDCIKPLINHTMRIADELYAIFINENNSNN